LSIDICLSGITLCLHVCGRHQRWPAGFHLRDASFAPGSMESSLLSYSVGSALSSCFLWELCGASSPPVRESPTFHTRRKRDGDQQIIQPTGDDAAMREHQSDDLAKRQREGTVLRNDFFSPIEGPIRRLAQWHLVRSLTTNGAGMIIDLRETEVGRLMLLNGISP